MFTDQEMKDIKAHIEWQSRALKFILNNCCKDGRGLTDEQNKTLDALGKPPGGPIGG